MADETTYGVLLDALEMAGLKRADLNGAGNSFRMEMTLRGSPLVTTVYPSTDAAYMMIHLTHPDCNMTSSLTKLGARHLGAFLLAWGHQP